jgi:hypothetical protein
MLQDPWRIRTALRRTRPQPSATWSSVCGPPNAGKTHLTRAFANETQTFEPISADQVIRDLQDRIKGSNELFAVLLNIVEGRAASTNLLVDAPLPQAYVETARARFGRRAMFVLLRLDQQEWRRRERTRGDRPPIGWDDELLATVLAQAGDDSAYDLVIDSTQHSPAASARLVRATVQERWGIE